MDSATKATTAGSTASVTSGAAGASALIPEGIVLFVLLMLVATGFYITIIFALQNVAESHIKRKASTSTATEDDGESGGVPPALLPIHSDDEDDDERCPSVELTPPLIKKTN